MVPTHNVTALVAIWSAGNDVITGAIPHQIAPGPPCAPMSLREPPSDGLRATPLKATSLYKELGFPASMHGEPATIVKSFALLNTGLRLMFPTPARPPCTSQYVTFVVPDIWVAPPALKNRIELTMTMLPSVVATPSGSLYADVQFSTCPAGEDWVV